VTSLTNCFTRFHEVAEEIVQLPVVSEHLIAVKKPDLHEA
jgi:hypothetical protein